MEKSEYPYNQEVKDLYSEEMLKNLNSLGKYIDKDFEDEKKKEGSLVKQINN